MITPAPESDAPLVGVLALQGNVAEHRAALGAAGARSTPVRRPEELAAVDGLVVPGGESTTIDRLLRRFGLRDPLRDRIAAGLPVLGSCAGMILLADRLAACAPDQETVGGLDIVVRRNAFGRQIDSFEADLAVTGIADPQRRFPAVFIRAPWVEWVGGSVQVLARVERRDGDAAAVVVRQGNLIATAFHPELTADHRIHELFVSMVRAC
ncbi:MAG: pyridoxal 5'-phosphate synthase glutaminase subunit PdxT [Propioniciclava sp.]